MPHGRGIRAYMDVFTACLRQRGPISCPGLELPLSMPATSACIDNFFFVNGTAVNLKLKTNRKTMNPLEFLAVMAETANKLDLDAHMNLISKQVSVYGVPDFEVITYDDWFNQCKYEFENKLLKKVSYQGLNILAQTPDRVMFKSLETVEGSDGSINTNGIEFIIQKEEDGQWRVGQERFLPADELESDKRRGAL